MAASRLKPLAAALLLCAALAHAAEQEPAGEPIELKTARYEVDFRSGRTIMHDVAVSQGDVSITAERAEATGLDFEDTRWIFSGGVRIQAERRGRMSADRAEVQFRDNRIVKATVSGSPARFEQEQTASNQMARGRAGQIVYEVAAGNVRFTGDAWLTNGENEISGPLLVYNIRQEKVQGQRVHITIVPKTGSPASASPQ